LLLYAYDNTDSISAPCGQIHHITPQVLNYFFHRICCDVGLHGTMCVCGEQTVQWWRDFSAKSGSQQAVRISKQNQQSLFGVDDDWRKKKEKASKSANLDELLTTRESLLTTAKIDLIP